MNKFVFIFTILLFGFYSLNAQNEYSKERFVEVSGIIMDESHVPVPGVAVISRKLRRGAVSENNGIYSITSIAGDTIFFRAIGFKRYHTIIPENFEKKYAKVDISLEIDTISVPEATILPWRTYSEFIKDMTQEKPSDPLIENMNENIASIYVAITNASNTAISPEAGYYNAWQQNFASVRTRGQLPVNNLLNPLAWSQFIREMKKGLLKNHTYKRPTQSKVIKKKKKSRSSRNK